MNLYIAPNGNDKFTGRRPVPAGTDGPLTTLAGARNAVRRYRNESGGMDRAITVHVADGTYELDDTWVLAPEDSGAAEFPVRYVAAEGAAPVISGGRRITDWRETEHNGRRCWIAELPNVAAGKWDFTRLYVNDAPRPRPRLPKKGFYRFTGLAGAEERKPGSGGTHDRANFAPGEIRKWRHWQDVKLVIYRLWFENHHWLKDIDEKACTVHFRAPGKGSLVDERGDFARYFVENVSEALDTPGEWYLDRHSGLLYYLPRPEETINETHVVAPRLVELVRLQGEDNRRVGHIRFENLKFKHQHGDIPRDKPSIGQAAVGVPGAIILDRAEQADPLAVTIPPVPSAITLDRAEQCVFYGCTVAHVYGYALETLPGSTGNTFAACAMYDTGAGGLKIGHEISRRPGATGFGEPAPDKDIPPMAATVADCTVRDCGRVFPSSIGIWIGNSGWNRIVHNHIYNCNYTGISCGWTWGYGPTRTVCNLIENNRIHHINHHEVLSDNGGIYTLGQQPGGVLRGNVIHDVSCYAYGGSGIYPDEGTSEIRVENNLVCGTGGGAYVTHYGRDILVENNIFALSQNQHIGLGKREFHRTTVFRRNIVLTMNSQLGGVGEKAEYNTLCKNLFWTVDGTPPQFGEASLGDLQADGKYLDSILADPLFTDAEGGDFSLRPDSPVGKVAFKPFDWRAAGPRMKGKRPQYYDEYTRNYRLPMLDVAIVRTKIELMTPADDIWNSGRAEFTVTLTNVGRAGGKGAVRLSAGPKGVTGSPAPGRIAYDLEPGRKEQHRIMLTMRKKKMQTFWLDSEPTNRTTVPSRRLVFSMAESKWHAPEVQEIRRPEDIQNVLTDVSSRTVYRGKRRVAEVTLGAGPNALLFLAYFQEPNLRPDLIHPWKGTGFELMSKQATEADKKPQNYQIFLVPQDSGKSARGLRMNATGSRAEDAPAIQTAASQAEQGCRIAAIIPWSEFGLDKQPAALPFELVIDTLDPDNDDIVQLVLFDMPSNAKQKLYAELVVKPPSR